MAVLLSIRPEFSKAIWNGSKRFEYRRRVFDIFRYTEIFVYTTAPISRVTGRFFVRDLIIGTPEQVWEATQDHAGIDKDRYSNYYSDRDIAFAIAIGDTEQFDVPLNLAEDFGLTHAPQSYAFVNSPLN